MADDWVKMRTDLYRDPKVCMIADQMLAKDGDLAKFVSHSCRRDMTVTRNVMRNAVVGALVTVWGVLRRRGHRDGDNLTLNTATLAVIDDIADMPGLGDALEFVGWVVQDAECVTLPNFFADYNVDPADEAKAKNAERQRRFREAKKVESSNVTVTLQRNAREEESREEKSNNTPPPPPAREDASNRWGLIGTYSPALMEAIDIWQQYQAAEYGRPAAGITLSTIISGKRSGGWDDAKIVRAIHKSVEWRAKTIRDPDDDFDKQRAESRGPAKLRTGKHIPTPEELFPES